MNDEKRVVEDQRRALDEEIADFQRRKVIRIFNINIYIDTNIISFQGAVRERQDELGPPHAHPGQARQEEVAAAAITNNISRVIFCTMHFISYLSDAIYIFTSSHLILRH